MKANVITRHGKAIDVFQIIDLPIPTISDCEVLIKVEATSVNPLDCKIRNQSATPREFPLLLGFDVCGVIVDKGKDVHTLKIGDRVIASPNVYKPGANAEYVVVDGRTCAIAKELTPEIVAALPLAGITAYESIVERLKISNGDIILIHAGAGGVGHMAIQIAKSLGAKVITTAGREESIDFCKNRLQVDCINYRSNNFKDAIKEYTNGKMLNYILDTVGGTTFNDSLDCLSPNGHICSILPVGIEQSQGYQNLLKNITVSYEFMGASTIYNINPEKQSHVLGKLIELINKKELELEVSHVYSLEELYKAHEQVESNRTIGKVVVKM